MKRVFAIWICLLYTFVTFGGSIYVHNCGDNKLLSVYEKTTHDSCPLCSTEDSQSNKELSCENGHCNDIEIKVDQLSDKFFSAEKAPSFTLSPVIFQRYWVDLKPQETHISVKNLSKVDKFLFTNTSPPIFILNRNIRN